VLYELLAGERPFRGQTLAQIHRAVLEQRPPPAHEVKAGVPKALAQIAARAMATDPDGRNPSAGAIARALGHWLETREPVATTPGRPPRKASRRRWLVSMVLAAMLLAAGAGWVALSQRSTPAGVLQPAPAMLPKGLVQIDVSPWAQVEVDGIAVGTAPPLNQLALPEGPHRITLRHATASPHSVVVEAAASQPVVVMHRFAP